MFTVVIRHTKNILEMWVLRKTTKTLTAAKQQATMRAIKHYPASTRWNHQLRGLFSLEVWDENGNVLSTKRGSTWQDTEE